MEFGGGTPLPLTLVRRSGRDTLGKLEGSSVLRMREAEALRGAMHPLGAVYLYGYVIETSLKAAYYRVIGLVSGTLVDNQLHRLPAENAIKNMAALPAHPQGATIAGHNVIGWARLLEQARAVPTPGRLPLDPTLANELHHRMQEVFECWAEFLRYRRNIPYNQEVETMRNSARWIRRRYGRLWR
jgi:hypothetical protein